jgi:uncharacterized protein (DUF1810 family)
VRVAALSGEPRSVAAPFGKIAISGVAVVADPDFDLERFVEAQNPIFADVLRELRGGHKTGHWMWFVFPQLAGLGRSSTARRYALRSRADAGAYLAHPVLGPRLRQCTQALLDVEGRSIEEVLGHPDDLKFRSCMTLFAHADGDTELFRRAIEKYFAGAFDPLTLARV